MNLVVMAGIALLIGSTLAPARAQSRNAFTPPAKAAPPKETKTNSPGDATPKASATAERAAGDDDPGLDLANATRWPLEELRLRDGRVLKGYIQSQGPAETEFVYVMQPPGRPMFCVIRPLASEQIASVQRLPLDERTRLRERIERFRTRLRIEAGQMDLVALDTERVENVSYRTYRGPWFTLRSTADDEMTRRVAVRLEQIFRGYRLLLPPRAEPERPLEVVLFGAMDEYHAYLRGIELPLETAAFYAPKHNRIVAGSDLLQFGNRLDQVRREHERIKAACDNIQSRFPSMLADLADELRKAGLSQGEIERELVARRAAWEKDLKQRTSEIAEANRRNEAQFADLTAQLFARLAHEAFHAYVENYVFPRRGHPLPRWLNEGLAQVFESGRLEGDLLRIDAPQRAMLTQFKADLAGPGRLRLADLLTAPDSTYNLTHEGPRGSPRHYLYAWALAYHLTFAERKLGTKALDTYVNTWQDDPLKAFEQLVGRKLDDYERQWRTEMVRE
jgi:hypothetical protein